MTWEAPSLTRVGLGTLFQVVSSAQMKTEPHQNQGIISFIPEFGIIVELAGNLLGAYFGWVLGLEGNRREKASFVGRV